MATLEKPKYIFSKSGRSITFDLIDFDIRKVQRIFNKSTNQLMFDPAMGNNFNGSISGNVLSLNCDVSIMADTDALEIQYDFECWYHKSHELGFSVVKASGIDSTQADLLKTGTGMTVAQTGGALVLTSGVSVNQEIMIRSKVPFSREMLFSFTSLRSAVDANVNDYVMLADKIGDGLSASATSATVLSVVIPSTNPMFATFAAILAESSGGMVGMKMFIGCLTGITGVPGQYVISAAVNNTTNITLTFTVSGWTISTGTVNLFGWNCIYYLETPATATTASFGCFRNGWPALTGVLAPTVNASTTVHYVFIDKKADRVTLSDGLIATSLSVPTVRASCLDGIPAEETKLYVYIWQFNGTSAPTSRTWTIAKLQMQEHNAQAMVVTDYKTQNYGLNPVYVVQASAARTISAGTAFIGDVGIQPRAVTGGFASIGRLLSAAASTNATSLKASAGRLYKIRGYNAAAALRYLKIYNKASAPTVGTDTPILTIALKASDMFDIDLGSIGEYFATGIAYALTTGVADADTGVLAAADILGMNIWYA